ncbi:uncharacterized protein [Diadema setosum]|uniref:uncharacterized protein isoform X2 n=1 Tax=Diadema setosum TaxID=31175 RepID=UPI003B3B1368
MREAHVVCRQLGYSSAASVYPDAHFGNGSGPIWMDHRTYCPTGNENSLLECYRWPWGCYPSRWSSSCGHANDVGVRCAGERNQSAVDEYYAEKTLTHGFTYDVDRFTYYDMTSELTFTPTSVNDGDILQCHVYGLLRSATLELEIPNRRPIQAPLPNTLSIDAVELRGKYNVVNLVISCHVNFTDQPFPYLHTYTIGTGNTTFSSSSSGSAILSPRPNDCINLTCSATNGVGSTTSTLWHCPKDAPQNDILSVIFESREDENGEHSFIVTCQIDPDDQPFPSIHTYKIAVEDNLVSISASPTATLDLRPTTCIDVVCTGLNDFGETMKSKSYCPRPSDIDPEIPRRNILEIRTREIKGVGDTVTLVITCHVDLSDQPFPHLHTYNIGVDNRTLSISSCASAILSPLPNGCVNVTCSATNGYGKTMTWMEHCYEETNGGGPIANPHRSALQQSSTTYALLVVIVILCVITVVMRRKFIFVKPTVTAL